MNCSADAYKLGGNSGSSTQVEKHVHYPVERSHAEKACAKVRRYVHIFRGMGTGLGTCELLARTRRRWGKIQVYQHRSTSMCTRVGAFALFWCTLTRRETCATYSEGCTLVYEHVNYLCALVEVGRKFSFINTGC